VVGGAAEQLSVWALKIFASGEEVAVDRLSGQAVYCLSVRSFFFSLQELQMYAVLASVETAF
jgi:hypothetical protein